MKTVDRNRVIQLLTELDRIDGVSGDETAVGEALRKYLAPHTSECYVDGIGNYVFVRKGKNPDLKVMVSAHMDEIGFMVHEITDEGRVRFVPVGMHNPRMLVNQVYSIHTENGIVEGVCGGGKPIHQNKGTDGSFGFGDVFIDIGADSKQEALDMGVALGDFVNIRRESRMLGSKYFCGKAVDDRAGCVAMVLAAEMLEGMETEATIYLCGTVQEEVGMKGARVVARKIRPDYAIALDVCLGAESKDFNPNGTRVYMGEGPSIQLYAWCQSSFAGNIVPKSMVKALVASAKNQGIPYQHEAALEVATDATEVSLANDGVPTGGISIPERYIHTSIGTVHIDDVQNAAKILAGYLADLKA